MVLEPPLGLSHLGDRFLLKEKLCRLYAAVGMKPALDNIAAKEIGEREQAHPLMVNHPGTHQLVAWTAQPLSGHGVVGRFVKPIGAEPSEVVHAAEIGDGRFAIHIDRQKRRLR